MPRIAGILSGFGSKTSIPWNSFFYAPGLGHIEPHLWCYLEDANGLLVDGTVSTDDELARHAISERRAREIGLLPLSGPYKLMLSCCMIS